MARNFNSLSEREILALAISLEEEDERVYADYAEGLRENFPASAAVFDGMRVEESSHRRRLIELYKEKFGDHIPLIRRQDVKGFVTRRPVWLVQPLGLETVRNQVERHGSGEPPLLRKGRRACARSRRAAVAGRPGEEERSHEDRAEKLEKDKLSPDVKRQEDEANRRLFVLQIVQPGLAGLMDGSVSTLAPVFAAAFATKKQSGCICGRASGVTRGRHQHGICGGAVGRWQPHRARTPLAARFDLRTDDGAGRHRPHAAVSDNGLPGGHGGCGVRRVGGVGRHHMDPAPLHGNAARSRQPCRSAWAVRWYSSREC